MTTTSADYRLEDRYDRDDGRVFLTSIQALARIVPDQLRRDRAAGLDTAGFLSGYPGSPLGGFDLEVARMLRRHPDLPIVHRPGVNEELGASAVMGSQLAAARPDAVHDGVVGVWYGKAPGLDRATDAIRHGVFAGTAPNSGAIALVGDDPAAKSSTMPSSSDAALVDLHMPILYPGDTAGCLELGLHAVALSRASGLWSAMKIVTPVADGSGTVDLPVLADDPVIPAHDPRPDPSAVFLGSARMVAAEEEFRTVRAELAMQYGIANRLNRITVDPSDAWIGLVATGYTYFQLLEALRRLGLDGPGAIRDAGIRLLHLRMPVPYDAELVRRFARGLSEILVVEEKNPTLEWLVKDTLYDLTERPAVVGKRDPEGRPLIPSHGLLDADAMLDGVRRRLATRVEGRLAPIPAERRRTTIPLTVNRTPFFCSGCPHNWGTKVPDGALVGAGTGCHGMSLLMPADLVGETFGITAMGNEGAHWIGMEPFVETQHVFQNFGDGTYFHSGQLAIQAAIGAGVSITFKILYNSTVAMTGGQDASFSVGVPELATLLLTQGVRRVVVTAPDVGSYDRTGLPSGVDVVDRTKIVEVQEELASTPGVTVLINDQACAAELRRGRRRGTVPTPDTRIVINHRICEGCGDCGDVSNCLSVQPIDTPFGRKTTIDQASCNFDYSCVNGDCPAFMEVDVTDVGRATFAPPSVHHPPVRRPAGTHPVRMAGIGGTGVVTAAQIVATAAMLDGWDVDGLDQTGLSQKAGPVVSDIVLTGPGEGATNLVGRGQAALLLAFDQLVGAADPVIGAAGGPETTVVVSTSEVPTGAMIGRPDIDFPGELALARLQEASASSLAVDALELASALVGEPATANVLMVGVACQQGSLPVSVDSLHRAIRLNGVAIDANLAAFEWGRAFVADPAAVEDALAGQRRARGEGVVVGPLPASLAGRVDALGVTSEVAEHLRLLAADLVGYQDIAWAGRFLDSVEAVARAEADDRDWRLTRTAATSLHKLMAYKDEYEVARLMVSEEAHAVAASVGGRNPSFRWKLHPPVLAALGRATKVSFPSTSAALFRVLAKGKRLRGTSLDPFGRTEMRRMERSLIPEFEAALSRLVGASGSVDDDEAVRIAGLPDMVRGYEALKAQRAAEYREELARSLSALG